MSNTNGLLITRDNIYGLINPPPIPDQSDGATPYQDPSSAAVRWDTFVDFSNNFTYLPPEDIHPELIQSFK